MVLFLVLLRFLLFLFMILIPLYSFYRYQKSKYTFFYIQHAGGVIGLDKDWYTDDEIEQFQKLLYLAKDKALEKSNKAVSTSREATVSSTMDKSPSVGQISIADEILKLNDLMVKGIISQEEFEKAKKELL